MSGQSKLMSDSMKAAADLSSYQYYFVKISAARTVNVCSAVTDVPYGVLQNKPENAGEAAEVMIAGITNLKIGASVTAGDRLGPEVTTGHAIPVTTDDYPYGAIARESGDDGDIISAMLVPGSSLSGTE